MKRIAFVAAFATAFGAAATLPAHAQESATLKKIKDTGSITLAAFAPDGRRLATLGGKQVKPEGFVSIRDGKPTKLVDRAEFSRLNFANNRGKSEPDATPPAEDEKHHVFAFGRMNPPTIGHGALVDKVKELAAAKKAVAHA